MGQGQQERALQLLHQCADNGEWLCLKNLHLVTTWLPVLEKEINTLQPSDKFRLWLTAEVHQKFSAVLLQSSLKITYEVGLWWMFTYMKLCTLSISILVNVIFKNNWRTKCIAIRSTNHCRFFVFHLELNGEYGNTDFRTRVRIMERRNEVKTLDPQPAIVLPKFITTKTVMQEV